jgi:hypothetical protein
MVTVKKPAVNQQNQTQTTTSSDVKPPIIIKISSIKKWKTFHDNESGFKLKYPPELSINTSRKDIILSICTLSPDDPYYNVPDAIIMNQFIIYSEQKNIDEIINEQKINSTANFTQKTININNIIAKQISYRGAYAGELWIDTLIKNGNNTIVISYPGDNQENKDIFDKIISTMQL